MKTPAVLSALLALLLGASAASAATAPAVTLKSSTLTFKQAVAACQPGALGAVSFTLGHARIVGLPGVSEQVDTSSSGIDVVTFDNDASGKSATATVNGHKNTVSAKNVKVKWNEQLACVMPD
jgi:type 1 fimbria pilin